MRLELRYVLKGLIGSILLMECGPVLSPLKGEPSVPFAFQVVPDPRRLPSGAAVSKALSIPMPVAIAFAPDGRIFITEKGGFQGNQETHVWVFDGLALRPWLTLMVSTDGERGLLGIALDPNFNRNHYVYLVYTSAEPQPLWRLVRYRDEDNQGVDPTILKEIAFDPSCIFHFSGNLTFGPDGRLYFTIGDLCLGNPAQYLEHPAGKMHRLNPDGTVPVDNPFYDGDGPNLDSVFAYGFRNTFAFVFDPFTQRIFGAENGPQCNDELNLIRPGGNYGWPWDFHHDTCEYADLPQFEKSLWVWKTPVAPAGIAVYSGPMFPEWNGSILVCTWNTGELYRFELNPGRTAVVGANAYTLAGAPCQIGPWIAPDGAVWFASSEGLYRLYRLWRNLPYLLPIPHE